MVPQLSYTIWFSQRTGSSLLCKALESTGVAGKPNEWLIHKPDLLEDYDQATHTELQEHLWTIGSTSNRVLELKHSLYEPHFSRIIQTFRNFPDCPPGEHNRTAIWENAFPNHRHIFMTRRNKVRLAVSWWKAIQTQEWHRLHNEASKPVDLTDAYSFDAIHHLYCECSMREAGIQEFFSEGNIVPLTIVYEDFVQEYEKTVRKILEFLELNAAALEIAQPQLVPTADDVSEHWVQRFRTERQKDWKNQGW